MRYTSKLYYVAYKGPPKTTRALHKDARGMPLIFLGTKKKARRYVSNMLAGAPGDAKHWKVYRVEFVEVPPAPVETKEGA